MVQYVYKTEDEWVGYDFNLNGVLIVSAHTNKTKYSIGMLKAMRKLFLKYGELITVLPYAYLVNFYSKHCEVTCLDEDNSVYVLKRKDETWV